MEKLEKQNQLKIKVERALAWLYLELVDGPKHLNLTKKTKHFKLPTTFLTVLREHKIIYYRENKKDCYYAWGKYENTSTLLKNVIDLMEYRRREYVKTRELKIAEAKQVEEQKKLEVSKRRSETQKKAWAEKRRPATLGEVFGNGKQRKISFDLPKKENQNNRITLTTIDSLMDGTIKEVNKHNESIKLEQAIKELSPTGNTKIPLDVAKSAMDNADEMERQDLLNNPEKKPRHEFINRILKGGRKTIKLNRDEVQQEISEGLKRPKVEWSFGWGLVKYKKG